MPDKVTTRCRIVINLSLKNSGTDPSPNDNRPKGPNTLKPMYKVFVHFRLYEVTVHFDLLKMFHTVQTGEPEKFMRLMVWRDGRQTEEWQSYSWKVVAFGDCLSSCVLEVSKDLIAHVGKDIDEVAATAISEDTYMDDGATGRDKETVRRLIGDVLTNEDGSLSYSRTLAQIFEKG